MTCRIESLVVAALDPPALARFWAGALGWDVVAAGDDVRAVPTDGAPVPMRFVPTHEAKQARGPVHLDLSSSSLADQTAAVEAMVGLGATPVDVGQTDEDTHVVLADPEGNELCILEPGNSFTDRRSRFGSITCDGSRVVGVFWSEVLGWPLVWDQDDETAVRAPDGTGPFLTWGPPVPPTDDPNRWRLEVAPVAAATVADETDRLVALGATLVGVGPDGRSTLTDPDGNAFILAARREGEGAA